MTKHNIIDIITTRSPIPKTTYLIRNALGYSAEGVLLYINVYLKTIRSARLEAAKTKKAETIAQLETAKEEIKKPFAFEDELKEKTERLNALNIELNLNEKDTSVMDTEPEQAEEQPERKCASRER